MGLFIATCNDQNLCVLNEGTGEDIGRSSLDSKSSSDSIYVDAKDHHLNGNVCHLFEMNSYLLELSRLITKPVFLS